MENLEDIRQLVRASGSVGANYIEANEKTGPGDLRYRMRNRRKEAKESMHFLGLAETFGNKDLEKEKQDLNKRGRAIAKDILSDAEETGG